MTPKQKAAYIIAKTANMLTDWTSAFEAGVRSRDAEVKDLNLELNKMTSYKQHYEEHYEGAKKEQQKIRQEIIGWIDQFVISFVTKERLEKWKFKKKEWGIE